MHLPRLKDALFIILIAFAVVSFWRGVWGLMDMYLFPENVLLSNWVSILIGVAILSATGYLKRELI